MPACCQIGRSSATERLCGCAGGVVKETGTDTPPGEFGVEALGRATWEAAGRGPLEMEKPIGG